MLLSVESMKHKSMNSTYYHWKQFQSSFLRFIFAATEESFPVLTATKFLFQYEDGDEVVLWMNTVGPYHNRQETYTYFSLPFCVGKKPTISHYHETLSEALQVSNENVI